MLFDEEKTIYKQLFDLQPGRSVNNRVRNHREEDPVAGPHAEHQLVEDGGKQLARPRPVCADAVGHNRRDPLEPNELREEVPAPAEDEQVECALREEAVRRRGRYVLADEEDVREDAGSLVDAAADGAVGVGRAGELLAHVAVPQGERLALPEQLGPLGREKCPEAILGLFGGLGTNWPPVGSFQGEEEGELICWLDWDM